MPAGAKSDAEVCAIRPALAEGGVELWTRAFARRILTDGSGRRAVAVEVERDGETIEVAGDVIVSACGAANSAALLLRSANRPTSAWSRQFVRPRRPQLHGPQQCGADRRRSTAANPTIFQKTIAINDFYRAGADASFPYPMGNLQPVGKVQAAMLASAVPAAPKPLLGAVATRSVDWWVMSEDLPDPANRGDAGGGRPDSGPLAAE